MHPNGVILQHFPGGMPPDPPIMVVPSALPLKFICDVTRLWRNFAPLGNFLRTPLPACNHIKPYSQTAPAISSVSCIRVVQRKHETLHHWEIQLFSEQLWAIQHFSLGRATVVAWAVLAALVAWNQTYATVTTIWNIDCLTLTRHWCCHQALASAGPDWKQFFGAPLSGVSRNFWWGASSHNHRNHERCERARLDKGNAKLGCLGACSSVLPLLKRLSMFVRRSITPSKSMSCYTQYLLSGQIPTMECGKPIGHVLNEISSTTWYNQLASNKTPTNKRKKRTELQQVQAN